MVEDHHFTNIGNFKPARWAAMERAFILDGGSFGISCSFLSSSGFKRFSIINEDDFSLVNFSLPDAPVWLGDVV